MKCDSVAVVGPTACGKTHRAVLIAETLGGEVISADSRQVYRGMSLGTGKDLFEYGDVPYHLIDIANAGEKYNLHKYLSDFKAAYNDIISRDRLPVICGGSGMYVENAIAGIQLPDVPVNNDLRDELKIKSLEELTQILSRYKSLHNTTDVDTCQRAIRAIEIEEYYAQHPETCGSIRRDKATPLNCMVFGINIPRDIRRKRITDRLEARLNAGMVEEIRGLLDNGLSPDALVYYGLEYKYVTLHVIGKMSYDEMFKTLETAIHQFAKRQMTWFRGMEKRGIHIEWLDYDMPDDEFISKITDGLCHR